MARAACLGVDSPILCLPPATGDLPEEGGLVVSSPATPYRKPIEHAGHSYQQQLIRTYALNAGPDLAHPADASEQKEKKAAPALRAHDGDAAKSLASKMAVGSDDLYELLELGDKRWHATADDIKKSFRRISLIYHPDKISHHGDEAKQNAESHFKAVMKAYDVLSDKKRRAAYDSVDDVDDSIPSERDATASPQRFYEKFGECFRLNARWCVSDRVPDLGCDETDINSVHQFYDFWYTFKSWRDFSYGCEYDVDTAESREEKRWMERQNAKETNKKKKEENSRIRRLVDLAYKHDPRIKREKQAVKAKKDAVKEERKRKAEEAIRLKKEQEEKEKLEAETKAADEKVRRAAAKKQKDAARQIVRKARQKLRAVGRELQIMETERGLLGVEGMCAEGNADTISAVTMQLASLLENSDRREIAYAMLDAARIDPIKPVSGEVLAALSAKEPKLEDMTDSSSVSLETDADADVDLKKDIAPEPASDVIVEKTAVKCEEKAARANEKPWTQEELSLLSKGVTKFPGGTRDRWNRLADYIGSRSADEVLRKVNENRPSKIKPGSLKQTTRIQHNALAGDSLKEKRRTNPDVEQRNRAKPIKRPSGSPPSQPPNVLAFTPKQQALFEGALKKHSKSDPSRWTKVGNAVGRSPEECHERFNELIAFYAAKRASQ